MDTSWLGPSPADQFLQSIGQAPEKSDMSIFGSPASNPIGLPNDFNPVGPPAGLESTTASVSAGPAISSAGGIWASIKQDMQGAGAWVEHEAINVYQGTKKVIGTVYGDVSSAAGTVVSDATAPLRQTYWYLIIGVIVIAGGIYFIGKGGAVKVNAIV